MLAPRTSDSISQHGDEWEQLAPLLDQLVARLGRADREAILLRYYREMTFAQVGAQTGATAEAARKRVDRAVQKLRELAARSGIDVSAGALSAHLLEQLPVPPPAGLIATATTAATARAGSAVAASSVPIAKGASHMMIIAKAKLIAIAAAACIGIAGMVFWIGTSLTSNAAAPATGPATQRTTRDPERRDYAKLSPFTSVRWRDSVAEVQVNDTWYELVSIDAVPAEKMVNFAKATWSDIWQKRFEEDLVEVMTRMGAEPRLSVKLGLRTLDAAKQDVTLDDVPMTHENRQKIWQKRWEKENGQPWPPPGH